MDPHLTLVDKLKRYPELKHSERPGRVRVEAPEPNGFALELHSGHDGWTVYLGEAGFHETFSSADEVLNFIAWCYSGEARVREFWRGSSPQKAILEAYQGDDWREISLTGYFVLQFWLEQQVRVFTNPKILRD
jgi:hypothetical protein